MNEQIKTVVSVSGIAVLLAASMYYTGKSVPDGGSGISSVRGSLDESHNTPSAITGKINNTEARTDAIAEQPGNGIERINSAQAAVDGLAPGERTAGEIVAECQRVIERIRQRAVQEV